MGLIVTEEGREGTLPKPVVQHSRHRSRIAPPAGHLVAALCASLAMSATAAHAQSIVAIQRDNYYAFLPPTPPIVAQTEGSRLFHLFGDPTDPAYRDEARRDGIDDRRADRLLEIAEYFSPILRRNTNLVPTRFEDVAPAPLRINLDVWQDHTRVDSTTIDLGPVYTLAGRAGDGGGASFAPNAPAAAREALLADSLLLHLVRTRGPRRSTLPIAKPEAPLDTILFVDLPGEEDGSWRANLGKSLPERSLLYAHPFIRSVESDGSDPRYEFVIQYWLYYPYNDAANNHEGDWEHLSVSITTLARGGEPVEEGRARGLLTAEDVRALLDPFTPTSVDSLRIRDVAYYFHHNVMILDYLGIDAGETMWRRADNNDGSIHVWEDTRFMDNVVRRRMQLADGRLGNHPIGYIGGNSKGMDELLQMWPRFEGSYNRDSHGTYPFPGTWRKVGPVDATEKIFGGVVPALRVDGSGRPDPALAWHELIDDDRYLVYRAEDIILLPDWEHVEPLVLDETDTEARLNWAWFILPLHMGFPATNSPGAGALKRVDLGNVAPMSPAYNTAWNRHGETAVYGRYEPTVLRVALAPISPLASLQSGWGILNVPIGLWSLLPGGSVALTQLLPWITGGMHVLGAPPAKTFYQGELPERFTSFSAGSYRETGGKDFARLLTAAVETSPAEFALPDGTTAAELTGPTRSTHWGSRAWFNVYFGPRLSMENAVSYGVSQISQTMLGETGESLGSLSARLAIRELTGGLTYRVLPTLSDYVRLHARAGWAWTKYSMTGFNLAGTPIDVDPVRGGRLPTIYPSARWWPNTGYAGLALEVFTPPRAWLFNRIGVGARIDVGGSLHRLEIRGDCRCRVTAERGDVAMMLMLGW